MPSYVFVDARVIDINSILAEIAPDVVAVVLDPLQDGLNQIAAVLSGQTAVDAVHILSHGADGTLYLGNGIANQANLAHYSDQLAAIGTALTADGDILLYGCDVAATDYGLAFIEALARASRADVAASTDATGSAILGGDAQLEAATGHIEAIPVLTDENAAGLTQLLAVPTLSGATANLAYTEQAAPIVLSPSITVTDADGMLAGATVRLNGFQPGDLLAATVGVTSINATYNAANGVLVLTGNDTVANYQQVLRSVTFSSSSDNPTNRGLNPTRTIDWQVNDGTPLAGPLYGNQNGLLTGSSPVYIATADFNGDGKPDLVTANRDSNDVSVLLGIGNGTFAAATNFTVGSLPTFVAVGDVNGDSQLDLVVANTNSANVSVLLGNGSGSFSAPINSVAGVLPNAVALGDLDSDGKLDLAVTNNNSVSILLGSGNGTFVTRSGLAFTTSLGGGVVVVDVNNDDKLDLIVTRGSSSLSVLLGSGNGTFGAVTHYTVGTSPAAIAVGDVNGDGRLDIAVANSGANGGVSVLLGNGNGTFAAPTTVFTGKSALDVAMTDVNGDGKLDLVTANFGGNDNSVLLGNGNGTFATAINFAAGTTTWSVAVADLNGDGSLDMATALEFTDNISVRLNASTNLSNTPHTTLTITAVNDAPTFTAMAAAVATVGVGRLAAITLADLKAQGNEADVDGTVDAFVVKTMSSGSLLIGTSAGSATPWAAGSNDTLDATHQAFWTGAGNTTGTLNAFTVVARDNGGLESSLPAVQATVAVVPITTYNWSALTNGQIIAFNPNVDLLHVDDPLTSAADIARSFVTGTVTLTANAKTITLQTDLKTLTTTNFTFADGSLYLVGDNSTATVNDDGDNTLVGGLGDDNLTGLGGNDSLSGGDGDDVFNTAYGSLAFGNDTMDGGAGSDRLSYSSNSLNAASVDLATGVANNTQGISTLISIENVSGTGAGDFITGNDVANLLNGRGGNDTLVAGVGNDGLTGGLGIDTAIFSGLASAYTITRNGVTTTISGPDGTDTLTSIELLQFAGGAVRSLDADRDYGYDGKTDILWRNTNGSVAVWQMDGFTQSNGAIVGSATTDWKIADGSGDYDGNGKSDLLWFNDNGNVAIWQMDGLTVAGGLTFSSVSAGWKIADGAGDYNADGKSDILLRHDNGNVGMWLMDGLAIASGLTFSSASADWKIADGAGDYNGDGKSDILWRNDNGNVAVWLMDGFTQTAGAIVSSASTDWKIADGSGDYNGDGKSDILFHNDNGNVAIWQMDGMNINGASTFSNTSAGWKIADGSGDHNGDGKSDILLHHDNGNVGMWLMDGMVIATGATISNASLDWMIPL